MTCSPRQPAPGKLASQIPSLFLTTLAQGNEFYCTLYLIECFTATLSSTALRTYFFFNYIHSIFGVVFRFGNWKTDGLQNWEGTIVAIVVETHKFGEIMLKLCNCTENFSFRCAAQ